jgi:predicted DCC family thiol-disulfide oxidoreductase YuxK
MKPLKNHVIIYDAECPMCALYTGVFTQYGWLEQNGRWKYSEIDNFEGCNLIDLNRSRNEIALVDIENKRVHYGLDSMLFIIAYKLPFLKPLFENAIFQLLMKQIYSLISYNRKVIAPSSKETTDSCVPDYNIFYRFAYIIIGLYIILAGNYYLGITYNIMINLIIGLGIFWILNVMGSMLVMGKGALIYLGQLVTILLIATFLTVPIILGVQFFGHSVLMETICFTLIAVIVLHQTIRRIKIAWRDYQNIAKIQYI